jgi:hypothetical protein
MTQSAPPANDARGPTITVKACALSANNLEIAMVPAASIAPAAM